VADELRIVHLVPNLNFGGLQGLVRGLALCQRSQGHSVTILCWEHPSNNPEGERELAEHGIRVGPARRAGHPIASLRSLRADLARESIDVVHLHNPFEYCVYGAIAARLARRPKVVLTIHATAMFDRFGRVQHAAFRLSARLSDRLVGVCREVRDITSARYRFPDRKLAVVDNGIDATAFLTVPARTRGAEVAFGTVGRMAAMKNKPLLVEAFAETHRARPATRLRSLGGSEQGIAELSQLAARRGVADAVELIGFSNDVPKFLAEIDVFAFSSNAGEGIPLTVLEAIASGLPVVSTATGGVADVIAATGVGWVTPIGDADALAAAMVRAVDEPPDAEAVEHAREVVATQYSIARMAADYEALYRSL
jgi:glycosyltransferase involved in cell wall biosynthesis